MRKGGVITGEKTVKRPAEGQPGRMYRANLIAH